MTSENRLQTHLSQAVRLRRIFLRGVIGGSALMLGNAACGGTPTTSKQPATATQPGTAAPEVGIANGMGDFAAKLDHLSLAISSNGQEIELYVCNGDANNPPTLAEWFRGPTSNTTRLDVNTAAVLTNPAGSQALVTFVTDAAWGNIYPAKMPGMAFTLGRLYNPNSKVGLYRAQLTVNGVTYLACWIAPYRCYDLTFPSSATTKATSPTQASSAVGADAVELVPSSLHFRWQGGAIINQQTHQLMPAPDLSPADIASRTVTVAGIGQFKLSLARNGVFNAQYS
jgi:hypothetical protein